MRTDYKSVCVPCRLRFERSRTHCPVCGGRDFCSASETARWQKDHPPRDRIPAHFSALHLIFGLSKTGTLTGKLELFEEAPPTWGAPTEGIIVGVDSAREAPLSVTRCVGFRLSGRVEGHAVDDADVGPFDLETRDGERIHVVPDPAALDVAVSDPGQPDAAAIARAAPFLALRGISGASMQLGEGLLRVGDAVVVYGDLEERSAPDEAYRGSARLRTLQAGIASPLVIRAITSATPGRTGRTGPGSPRA